MLRSRKILSLVIVSAAACGSTTPAPEKTSARPLFDPSLMAIERSALEGRSPFWRVTKAAAPPAFTVDMAMAALGYDEPLVAPNGRPACGNVVGKGSRGTCK